ncbi:hypothetical protein AB0J52_38860, partial [Spirillospora sp. NPDC049652]
APTASAVPRTSPSSAAASLHIMLINARRDGGGGLAADLTVDLTALADLLRDRPVQAAAIYRQLHLGGHYSGGAVSREVLPVVHTLLDKEHTAAQLLALRLVRRGGRDAGWPDEWREPLARLRASPHADVAEPAWDVSTDDG